MPGTVKAVTRHPPFLWGFCGYQCISDISFLFQIAAVHHFSHHFLFIYTNRFFVYNLYKINAVYLSIN